MAWASITSLCNLRFEGVVIRMNIFKDYNFRDFLIALFGSLIVVIIVLGFLNSYKL